MKYHMECEIKHIPVRSTKYHWRKFFWIKCLSHVVIRWRINLFVFVIFLLSFLFLYCSTYEKLLDASKAIHRWSYDVYKGCCIAHNYNGVLFQTIKLISCDFVSKVEHVGKQYNTVLIFDTDLTYDTLYILDIVSIYL